MAYDVTQDHDSINCNTSRRNIMLRACDDARHPFWYARVLGIYHVNTYFGASIQPERMDFLFVRWFGRDPDWQGPVDWTGLGGFQKVIHQAHLAFSIQHALFEHAI
jgi:hypothetical protein